MMSFLKCMPEQSASFQQTPPKAHIASSVKGEDVRELAPKNIPSAESHMFFTDIILQLIRMCLYLLCSSQIFNALWNVLNKHSADIWKGHIKGVAPCII